MESVARPEQNSEFGVELIREWMPPDAVRGVVVLVHGLAEHSGRYERTGSLLADAGFHVRSFDLIGGGASGGARWDIDEWDRFYDQIDRHVRWASTQDVPLILMGHSLGAHLALGYTLQDRIEPNLLVLSAPAMDGGAAWQKALAPIAAKLLPKVSLPNGIKGKDLSNDPAVGEAYFSDPLVVPKSTTRFGAAFFDSMDVLNETYQELEVPTLVLHGGLDSSVPPQATAPLGELDNCTRVVYPGLQHEILNEPEGPDIVQDIIDWIEERL